jgi:hydrophobic/amphiphilic exporter-1 (mainly G- bacteria), HAE1 family
MISIVGTLPIALGLGAGAELRRPLGIAVVGGLLIALKSRDVSDGK